MVAGDVRPSARRMAWVATALGACFVAVRVGLPYAPPLWFATLRALVAGVALAALAFSKGLPLPRRRTEWAVIAGLGVANATVGGATMYEGAVNLSTGVASVLANAQPLLILLPAWALYGERPTNRTMLGLAVGFVGLVIVAVPGGGGSGAALSLASAAAATVGTLIARQLGAIPDVVAGGWSFLLGGAALAVWAAIAEGSPAVRFSPRFVAALVFLGIIGTAAVYVAWFKEARRCPLYRLAAWTFAVPAVGLVLAVTVEGERPSVWTATGMTVVLASLWLVLRGSYAAPAPAPRSGERDRSNGDRPRPEPAPESSDSWLADDRLA